MWHKIVNPINGRKVNITSHIGQQILREYMNQANHQIGGSLFTSNYSCDKCGKDLSQEVEQFYKDSDGYYNRKIAFDNVLEEHQDEACPENSGNFEEQNNYSSGDQSSEKQYRSNMVEQQKQRMYNLDYTLESGDKEYSEHFREMYQENISTTLLELLDENYQPNSTLEWNKANFMLLNPNRETVAVIRSYKFVNGGLELEITENNGKNRSNNKLYILKGHLINKNTFIITSSPQQVFKKSFINTYPISKTLDNTPIQFIWNDIQRRGTRTDSTISSRGNKAIANGESIYRHWNTIYQEFSRPNALRLERGIGIWVYAPQIIGRDNETENMLGKRMNENSQIINNIWLHLLGTIGKKSSYRLVFPVNIVSGEDEFHAVNCIIELEGTHCVFYYYDSHPEQNGEDSIGSTIVVEFQQLFREINYTFEWRGHLLQNDITNVQFDDSNCQVWRLIFGWIVMANPLLSLEYIAKDYFMRVRNNPLGYMSNFIGFIEQFNNR